MEEAGEGRRGVILTRRGIIRRLYPPPTTPRAPFQEQNHLKTHAAFQLRGKVKGQGAMVSGPLVSVSSQTASPFQFRVAFPFPIIVINMCPRWSHQLFLFPNQVVFQFSNPVTFYLLPFSLMVVVCLMLLLPDDLITEIIIHSIKDEPIIRFLILRNQICSTFRRICDSDEVLLDVSLCELCQVCRNRYVML
jgi:hypothetical protein